jgi:hypothetical protein
MSAAEVKTFADRIIRSKGKNEWEGEDEWVNGKKTVASHVNKRRSKESDKQDDVEANESGFLAIVKKWKKKEFRDRRDFVYAVAKSLKVRIGLLNEAKTNALNTKMVADDEWNNKDNDRSENLDNLNKHNNSVEVDAQRLGSAEFEKDKFDDNDEITESLVSTSLK